MSRSLSLLVLAVVVLGGAPARGQAPPPPARRRAPPAVAPAVAPAAAVEPASDPGELRVRAESYEQVAKGHFEARGLVDLRLGAMRIQADKADVYEDPQPDGSVKRRLVAEGNVVFIRGEERLSGDRVEMDESGRGFFENAVGFVEPGVFIEGRRVERVDDDTYRVEGGKFTSCAQPNPRWSFTASSARVEVDDKVVAKNSVLKVKGIPVFYAPYIYYPIRRDGRSTGFLFPHFGYSSYRGFNVGTGFFWAMGRSLDQTLLRGLLLEGRLRLRPRAALRRGLAVAGHVPHVPLPVPGHAHGPRPRHRRGRGGRHAGQHGLRHRLERPADAARRGPRHRERPQVQQPHLQPALPGQLQPGHEPHRALVGGAREGPASWPS